MKKPEGQAIETVEYRLCVAYANRILSKEQYAKFLDLLPLLKAGEAPPATAPSKQPETQQPKQSTPTSAPTSSSESAHPAGNSPPPPAIQSTQGFDISLSKCERHGGTVLCRLLITNRERERHLQLSFIGNNQPRAFCADGAEHAADLNESHLGSLIGNSDVTMPTDIPVQSVLTIRDVPQSCQSFTALQVWFYSSGPPTNVVLRNVPIAP